MRIFCLKPTKALAGIETTNVQRSEHATFFIGGLKPTKALAGIETCYILDLLLRELFVCLKPTKALAGIETIDR